MFYELWRIRENLRSMLKSLYNPTTYLPHQSAFLWNIQLYVGSPQTGQWAGLDDVSRAHAQWLKQARLVSAHIGFQLAVHDAMSQRGGNRNRPRPYANMIRQMLQTRCIVSASNWSWVFCTHVTHQNFLVQTWTQPTMKCDWWNCSEVDFLV